MENNENMKYFFVHVPKSAGTSFRKMLHSIFTMNEVYPTNAEIKKASNPYVNVKMLKGLKPNRIKKTKLFHGHMPHFCVKHLNYPIKKLTFLRDPVQRTISNLYHLQRHNKKYKESTLNEILKKEPLRFNNRQTRYFLNSEFNLRRLDQHHLDVALFNLEKMDFLGITERYDESIELLSKTFNWTFEKIEKLNQNKAKKKSQYNVEEDVLDLIKQNTKLDEQLYAYGLLLFNQRVKEKGNS